MNCPIHRIRQLSKDGFCVDCSIFWRKEALEYFELKHVDLLFERDEQIEKAKTNYNIAVAKLAKYCKALNKENQK